MKERVHTASIVVEHLEMLREAARRADVQYELGPTITFTSHSEYSFDFRPVYCSSVNAARLLQESYKSFIAGARDIPRPGHDSLFILPRE